MKNTITHKSYLKRVLANPAEAAAYLNAEQEEGEMFYLLKAIRNVAAANGGMGALAKAVKMSRTSLYKTLSATGNPQVDTLRRILAVYGVRLGCFAIESPQGHHKRATGHGHYTHP